MAKKASVVHEGTSGDNNREAIFVIEKLRLTRPLHLINQPGRAWFGFEGPRNTLNLRPPTISRHHRSSVFCGSDTDAAVLLHARCRRGMHAMTFDPLRSLSAGMRCPNVDHVFAADFLQRQGRPHGIVRSPAPNTGAPRIAETTYYSGFVTIRPCKQFHHTLVSLELISALTELLVFSDGTRSFRDVPVTVNNRKNKPAVVLCSIL